MNTVIDSFVPKRASVRAARDLILAKIAEVDGQLSDVEGRSRIAPDPSYSRSAVVLRQQRQKLFDKLDVFDAEQKRIEAAETSTETKVAKNKAFKAAKLFEQRLQALSEAAFDLKESIMQLNKAAKIRDPGHPLHKNVLEPELSSRIVDVIGSVIPLAGYGSSLAKRPEEIWKHFE